MEFRDFFRAMTAFDAEVRNEIAQIVKKYGKPITRSFTNMYGDVITQNEMEHTFTTDLIVHVYDDYESTTGVAVQKILVNVENQRITLVTDEKCYYQLPSDFPDCVSVYVYEHLWADIFDPNTNNIPW